MLETSGKGSIVCLLEGLGFIVGAGVLVVGIIVRSLEHKLDFWLVITLTAMVLAKIVGLIYSRRKH